MSYPTAKLTIPPHVVRGEQSAASAVGDRAERIVASRRWARGRWASEREAKLAAAMALLALPRKPRRRPARTDRLGLPRWIAARADAEGRDDDDDDGDGDGDEQSERNFA